MDPPIDPAARARQDLKDLLGCCLWALSLPLLLGVAVCLELLGSRDELMLAVLFGIPFVLWLRFVWRRVLGPFLRRRWRGGDAPPEAGGSAGASPGAEPPEMTADP